MLRPVAPATVLVACLLAFGALAADVMATGALARADPRIEAALADGLSPSARERLGTWMSLPGDDVVFVGLVAAVAAALLLFGRRRDALVHAAAGGVLALAVPLLKGLFARPRPDLLHEGFAFPSGHAAKAALAFGLAVVMLARAGATGGARATTAWALAAAAFVLCAGLGRVLGGVHWTSDVLGGWALGAAVAAAAAWAASAGSRRRSG